MTPENNQSLPIAENSHRRQFLLGLAGVGITGIAGCLGDDDDDTEADDGDEPGDDDVGDDDDDEVFDESMFDVRNLEPSEVTATVADTLDVQAVVTNTGGGEGTQEIEFRIADESLASQELRLEFGNSETIVFEGIELSGVEPGEHTFGIYSRDDEATGTITIEEVDPAFFAITDIQPGDVSVVQGDVVDISATIQNTGDESGTQDVALIFDGDTLESESVSLEGGESETVGLGEHETEEREPGEYDYTVQTDDDEAGAVLTIEEPPLLPVPFGLNTGGAVEDEEPQSAQPVVIQGVEFVDVNSAQAVDDLNNVHIFGEEPDDADWFEPPAQKGSETGAEIANTDHDALYQTELFGYNMGFQFDISNGTYDVILHNAEIFHEEAGARVFDILVQDEMIEDAFDIYASAGGENIAHDIVIEEVEVTDETLTIETETHEDFSKFAGIGIRWGGDVIEDGLEAYFSLNGSTPTNEVTGNDATIVGDPTPGVDGFIGNAWEFEMNEDVDDLTAESALESEPLPLNGEGATVGAWFYWTNFQEWARAPYQVGGSAEDFPAAGWSAEWDQLNEAIICQLAEGGSPARDEGDTVAVEPETWYFVVTVIDEDGYRLHVFDADGELEESPATGVGGRTQSDEEPLMLMAADGRDTEGRIEEVWGYSRAFSEGEVYQLYQQSMNPP